jgi:hypothetical protein
MGKSKNLETVPASPRNSHHQSGQVTAAAQAKFVINPNIHFGYFVETDRRK